MRILKLLTIGLCLNFGFLQAMEDDDYGLAQLFEEGQASHAVVGPINISGAVDDPEVPWKYWVCGICWEPRKKVIIMPCNVCKGHSICKACFQALAQHKCPFCRGGLVSVNLSQLPEYTAESLWECDLVSDQLLGEIVPGVIRSIAEQTLSEERSLEIIEQRRHNEQQLMKVEDRESLAIARDALKAALLKDIQDAHHKLKYYKRLKRCNECGTMMLFIYTVSFMASLIWGICCAAVNGPNERGYITGCRTPGFLMLSLVGGAVFLPLLGLLVISNNKKCSDFCGLFCAIGAGDSKILERAEEQLQSLEGRYRREFGDDNDDDHHDGAASSSAAHDDMV